jgi:hypothetical protein
VRGDHRHLRLSPDPAVVQTLARMAAGTGAPCGGRRQPDELADNPCGTGMTSQFSGSPQA